MTQSTKQISTNQNITKNTHHNSPCNTKKKNIATEQKLTNKKKSTAMTVLKNLSHLIKILKKVQNMKILSCKNQKFCSFC